MQQCPFDFFTDGKRHCVCLVGGGGKTTLLYELATQLAEQGRRVVVLTSTHILRPSAAVYAANLAAVQRLWQQDSYAVIGTEEQLTGKLIAPPPELYATCMEQADYLLCEADGAKHRPCKAPAEWEPMLLPECDVVIGVAGADALGRPLADCCFRSELAAALLGVTAETRLTPQLLAHLLLEAQGTRKNVGSRAYYLVINKCDTITAVQGRELCQQLLATGQPAERLWLRAERERQNGEVIL